MASPSQLILDCLATGSKTAEEIRRQTNLTMVQVRTALRALRRRRKVAQNTQHGMDGRVPLYELIRGESRIW